MKAPFEVAGRKLTEKERMMCWERGLTNTLLNQRLKKGMQWSEIFAPKKTHKKQPNIQINGRTLTDHEMKLFKENKLNRNAVFYRLRTGWSWDEALRKPLNPRAHSKKRNIKGRMTKEEAIKLVLHVRKLNQTPEFIGNEIYIPKIEAIAGMKVNE